MKRLSAILLLLIFYAQPARGDVGSWTCSSPYEAATGTSHSFSVVVTACTNCALFLAVTWSNAGDAVTGTPTFNTTENFTVVTVPTPSSAANALGVWRLVAPTVTTANVAFTTSTNAAVGAIACYADGINQSAPTGTVVTANNDAAAALTGSSLTITVSAGGSALDVMMALLATVTVGADQTQVMNQDIDNTVPVSVGKMAVSHGTASPMDWTWASNTNNFLHAAVPVEPAVATRRPIAPIIFP